MTKRRIMTLSVTAAENTSFFGEKSVLSPQLMLLTHSLRKWEAPVCSDVSAKSGAEERYRLSVESVIGGPVRSPLGARNLQYPAVNPSGLFPQPGSAEVTRLTWTIDKATTMLSSGDHIRISPAMEVSLGAGQAPAKFKLMLKPKVTPTYRGKGGACFRKAKGQCFIELKCEEGQDVIGDTQFSLWVGDRSPRGPVEHNFSNATVGRLPKDLELWDMKNLLGQAPQSPDQWDLKMPVAEGCLVLGIEISVLKNKPCAFEPAASDQLYRGPLSL